MNVTFQKNYVLHMKFSEFYLCFLKSSEIWRSFSQAPIRNFVWYYYIMYTSNKRHRPAVKRINTVCREWRQYIENKPENADTKTHNYFLFFEWKKTQKNQKKTPIEYDPQKQFSKATLEQRKTLLRTDPAVIWPVNHSLKIK